jgi:thiamine biosynthesis protein ThiC
MEWFNSSIAPLKDLLAFLYKKSKTNDVNKKQVIIELRDNLNVFKNGFINQTSYDTMIDLLSRDAIQSAIKENFSFKKLRAGTIPVSNIYEERNKKYAGWTSEKLVDKIDEKIVELKNIKKMNYNTVTDARNNISLMMSNLYFRMKLLADFIKSE